MGKRTRPSAQPARPSTQVPPSLRWPSGAVAGTLLILLASVAVCLPSLNGGFLLDDDKLLTDNTLIKAPDGLSRFWLSTEAYDYWPVANTTLWLEWRLWGMNPTGYRLTNLALHVVAALLIWVVLRRLSIPAAFLAALLFAVHPVNVESVAWISQRKSLLALLFSLLSVLAYLRTEARARPGQAQAIAIADGWYWLSLAMFVLAMLSKVSAAVLPVVLLGIVAFRRSLSRWDLARLAPFFLVDAVLIRVNVWFRTHGAEPAVASADPIERLLGAAGAVWFYLSKALLPVDLAFTYPEWRVDSLDWRWWLALAAAVATTGVLWRYRRTWSRAAWVAWLYFGVALVPVLGFTDVGFMQHIVVADHYLQMALIGVTALAAIGWSAWRARTRTAWAPRAAAAIAVGVLGLLTWRQSGLYADATTLYRDTLAKNPDAWMAHTNLGAILSQAGRPAEAIEHFQQALRVKPDYPEALGNLGRELAKAGRLEEAIAHYRRALARPYTQFPEGHNNLGEALALTGRLPEAVEQYRYAIALKPDLAEAHNNMGNALIRLGQFQEAIGYCQQAARLKPSLAEAYYNLGNALLETGRGEEAIESYRTALRLRPGYAEVHGNLGTALVRAGRVREGIGHFRQAVQLNPDLPNAQSNLALALTMTDAAAPAGTVPASERSAP